MHRELVTPPPSKRSRRDTSGSSTRHKDVDLNSNDNTESAPDSPTMRAMRSLAPDRSITPALYNTSLYSGGGIASVSTMYKTRSQTREGGAPPLPPGSQVIQLDSDSEPETTTPAAAAAAAAPVEIIDQALTLDLDLNADAPEDDDEFAEYVRKAQEERDKLLLQKEQEAIAAGTITPTLTPASQPPPTGLSSPAPASQTAAAAAASAAAQSIALIITSDIPDSHMCLVKFRFDRPLRVVRDSWTALQHKHGVPLRGLLDRDDDVILTWRRKKVYMTSTLLSLGIRPSDDGSGAALVDDYSRDGFNESRTRVHMQAWTPALFAQMERVEEEAARRRRSHDDDDDDDNAAAAAGSTQGTAAGEGENATAAAAAEEEEEEEVQLRIILKSRDKGPVKLRVRPETTTETLVAAFCAQRAVPDGADVGLWFDGMRLASGATMEDADIDDLATIEVHVR